MWWKNTSAEVSFHILCVMCECVCGGNPLNQRIVHAYDSGHIHNATKKQCTLRNKNMSDFAFEWKKKIITNLRAPAPNLNKFEEYPTKTKQENECHLEAHSCAITHHTFKWQLANFFCMSSPFESAPIIPQNTTFISPSIDRILDVFSADPPGWEFKKTHLETHETKIYHI